MKRIVDSGKVPGILAYAGGEPVGWCAVATREAYPRLARSRILKPVDDQPVWSVVCFFIAKPYRQRGLTRRLLQAAVEHVRKNKGRILEGYPVEPKKNMPDPFVYTGLASAFRKAGFKEVARRSETRPIMRYEIG
jgi:GNAT superfamily N-acetyltransferase